MPRERDKNRKLFHRGHYEVIAARFREQLSRYVNEDGQSEELDGYIKAHALRDLAEEMSARFEFDNDEHDTGLFMERCGFINVTT